MIELKDVINQVNLEAQQKLDYATNMQQVTPIVGQGTVGLRLGKEKQFDFTKVGLASFLNRINVPVAFFKRSSDSLKQEILAEHFPKSNRQDVILRTNGDRLRFIASSRYGKFDDTHVAEALMKVPNIDNYVIKQFHQDDDNFVLRITTKDPIRDEKLRPFFPGIHIENSETGRSSVSIKYLLYEEVCTNGMMVVNSNYASFEKRHIGKRDSEVLIEKASGFINNLEHFTLDMESKLLSAMAKSKEEVLEAIDLDSRIPSKVKEVMQEFIPKYSHNGVTTGLDIMSAYTETIQRYNWNSRTELEQIAGELLYA